MEDELALINAFTEHLKMVEKDLKKQGLQ